MWTDNLSIASCDTSTQRRTIYHISSSFLWTMKFFKNKIKIHGRICGRVSNDVTHVIMFVAELDLPKSNFYSEMTCFIIQQSCWIRVLVYILRLGRFSGIQNVPPCFQHRNMLSSMAFHHIPIKCIIVNVRAFVSGRIIAILGYLPIYKYRTEKLPLTLSHFFVF